MRLHTDNVDRRRRRLGLTKQEAAERLGISQPYYSLLMAGKRKLTVNIVEKLYFEFNLKLNEIFDLTP